MTTVRFTIVDGPEEGSRYEFRKGEISIGRGFSNDLILSHLDVADRHLRIVDTRDEVYLEDLTGEDRTKLNGMYITREPLHNGDEIEAGPYVFHIALVREETVPDAEEDDFLADIPRREGRSPLFKRTPVLILATLLLILGAYGAIRVLTQERVGKDLSSLGPLRLPVEGVFGCKVGGKTYVDKVEFSFLGQRPKYRIQYRPGHIQQQGEVELLVNGGKLGSAPITVNRWADDLVTVEIPQSLLRMRDQNLITFDNVKNPPEQNKWGVRDVSVQEVPIPKCDVEVAQKYLRLANEKYEERRINEPNLYDAIKYMKEGLEYVIACENAEMRNLLLDAANRYEKELEELYSAYLFNTKKFLKLNDLESARFELEEILRHIPDESDRRHRKAKDLLERVNRGLENG